MPTSPMSPRAVVEEICRLFAEHRFLEAVDTYFAPGYIEHNPDIVGGGREGFRQHLFDEGFDKPDHRPFDIDILRIVAEGDEVAVHLKVSEPGKPAIVVMEFYRVENGLAVEHWDVMQQVKEDPVNTRYSMA